MTGQHGGPRPGSGRPKGSKSKAVGIAEARLRKEIALASLRELEVQQKRGELIPITQSDANADLAARVVRDTFLALPDRVAALLLGQDERQIAMILRAEIRLALERVAGAIQGET